ncbi:MAG: sulfite exporter TauE/SafE family protein [Proteobacteria bacterium]|nr:sulfite exporter TauE/SafE family protein [Pseudomonadota bacterium]
MTDTSLAFAVLAAAAFGAGVLNAIAGGGTFLTFPALVWAGVPPIAANATSALAVCPGYLGSTLGFRAELAALPRALLAREALLCAIGGVIGALLLLVTPAQVFARVVPWLLLFATALFSFGPRLSRWAGGAHGAGLARLRLPGLAAVAVYGGYFNGGLGILLMALYLVVGETRLDTVNALKNLNSFVLSVVSVVAFALGGAIVWREALLMALFATLGGFAGARLAKRLPTAWVRAIVIVTGLVMSALFFLRTR